MSLTGRFKSTILDLCNYSPASLPGREQTIKSEEPKIKIRSIIVGIIGITKRLLPKR